MAFDYFEKRRQSKLVTRKKTLSHEVKKSIYMLIFTLLSIIIMLSVVILMNTNQAYQKGYTLKEQQIQKDDLELESRTLVNKIINAQVYNKIEESPLISTMQKAEKPIYIKPPKGQ
jgi:high-affinity nickel permease